MKNVMKYGLMCGLLFLLGAIQAEAQTPLDRIGVELKNKNVKALAPRFDASISLTILDKEGTFSRAQAAQIVRTFLTKSQPSSFKIIHRGASGGSSRYGIGEMITARGKYRVYIYLKEKGGKPVIQELRFEQA